MGRTESEVGSVAEILSLIVRGTIVSPTVRSVSVSAGDNDIVLIPFTDLPPMPPGLIWPTVHTNVSILTFADTARTAGVR